MNVALRRTMTLDDFLVWEAQQEERYEFDGFQPVAMNGGTVAHAIIGMNLTAELCFRLRGKQCRAYGPSLKALVAGRVRYPDAVVTCTPVPRGTDVVPDPVVVFEVLSASTAATDRIAKNEEYRLTPSITRYVMLEQTSQAATVFARAGDDWVGHVITGDALLAMPEIGVELPLPELYANINLGPNDAPGNTPDNTPNGG